MSLKKNEVVKVRISGPDTYEVMIPGRAPRTVRTSGRATNAGAIPAARWVVRQVAKEGRVTRQRPAPVSRKKARQILHEGVAAGYPLTRQQQKFFGALTRRNPRMHREEQVTAVAHYLEDMLRNAGAQWATVQRDIFYSDDRSPGRAVEASLASTSPGSDQFHAYVERTKTGWRGFWKIFNYRTSPQTREEGSLSASTDKTLVRDIVNIWRAKAGVQAPRVQNPRILSVGDRAFVRLGMNARLMPPGLPVLATGTPVQVGAISGKGKGLRYLVTAIDDSQPSYKQSYWIDAGQITTRGAERLGNPLTESEAREVMSDVRFFRRMEKKARPETSGYYRGLAVGKATVVKYHGPRTKAHHRRLAVDAEKIRYAEMHQDEGYETDSKGKPRIKRNSGERRCAVCTAKLPAVAPPWAPQGSRFGLCHSCAESRPQSAKDDLLHALAAEQSGPYIVRGKQSGSYAAEAPPHFYPGVKRDWWGRTSNPRRCNTDESIQTLARLADQGDADAFKKLHAEVRRRGILPPGYTMRSNEHGFWATAPGPGNKEWFPGATTYPTEADATEAARGHWFISWNARHGWTAFPKGMTKENPRQRPAGNKCGMCKHHISMHLYRGGDPRQGPQNCRAKGCRCKVYVQKGARYYNPISGLPSNWKGQHISHGFYRVTEVVAKHLNKGRLPGHGREALVFGPDGKHYWLARTTLGGKQVWSVRDAGSWGLRDGQATTGWKSNPNQISCAGCSKPFGHGRALYVPTHGQWFHEKCFKFATHLPSGTRAFKRKPTSESLAQFAEFDAKFKKKTNPNSFTPAGPTLNLYQHRGEDPDPEDLVLYADNTYELYNQKQSIEKNLLRKIAGKRYDYRQAPKLWMYWLDAAAKRYCKEIPDDRGRPWNVVFPKIVRERAATQLSRAFEWEVQNGSGWSYPEWAKAKAALGRKDNPRDLARCVHGKICSLKGCKHRHQSGCRSIDCKECRHLGAEYLSYDPTRRNPSEGSVQYIADLSSPPHVESVELGTLNGRLVAELTRYLKHVRFFVPTERQISQIKARRGKIEIRSKQIRSSNGRKSNPSGPNIPMGKDPKDYTNQEKEAYISWLASMSLSALRKRQDICQSQIKDAWKLRKTSALRNLQAVDNMIADAIMRREFGKKPNPRVEFLQNGKMRYEEVDKGHGVFVGRTGGEAAVDITGYTAGRGWKKARKAAGVIMHGVDAQGRRANPRDVQAWDIVQINNGPGKSWQDYAAIRPGEEAQAKALVRRRPTEMRIVSERRDEVVFEVKGNPRAKRLDVVHPYAVIRSRATEHVRLHATGCGCWECGGRPAQGMGPACKRCKGMEQVVLGKRLVRCPICCRKANPLTGHEVAHVNELRLLAEARGHREDDPYHRGHGFGAAQAYKIVAHDFAKGGPSADKLAKNPGCNRCKGAQQVRLGPRMVRCPLCCRKAKNPLTHMETLNLIDVSKASRKLGGRAFKRGDLVEAAGEFGFGAGVANAANLHGPVSLQRKAGNELNKSLAGAVATSSARTRKRNPLDSHDPATCRCWHHKKLRGEGR